MMRDCCKVGGLPAHTRRRSAHTCILLCARANTAHLCHRHPTARNGGRHKAARLARYRGKQGGAVGRAGVALLFQLPPVQVLEARGAEAGHGPSKSVAVCDLRCGSSRLTAVLLSCVCLWSAVRQIQAHYGNALLTGADWHAAAATLRVHQTNRWKGRSPGQPGPCLAGNRPGS